MGYDYIMTAMEVYEKLMCEINRLDMEIETLKKNRKPSLDYIAGEEGNIYE